MVNLAPPQATNHAHFQSGDHPDRALRATRPRTGTGPRSQRRFPREAGAGEFEADLQPASTAFDSEATACQLRANRYPVEEHGRLRSSNG